MGLAGDWAWWIGWLTVFLGCAGLKVGLAGDGFDLGNAWRVSSVILFA